MARLTHALDEIYVRLMDDLETVRVEQGWAQDEFSLHVEDRFGEYVSDRYWDWAVSQ